MQDINLSVEVAQTTAKTIYFPVPCRGIVHAAHVVCNGVTNTDDTVTISRGASAVNVATGPSTTLAAGNYFDGEPDTTNKDLIFDPDDDTAANQVLKIAFSATYDAASVVGLHIEYDDSAAVTQSST